VHHHVIVRHPVHTSLVRRRASLHHPHHVLPAHSHHAVIVHGRSAPHRPVVRHATVVRRHAALCQQVMVHQHWVQHCR
jgi:hypothetical protein